VGSWCENVRAQQTFFGITNAGQLLTINPLTGAGTMLLPGPTIPMSAIGLGFYNGRLYTFDNMIGGFRELNPATGENVGTPVFVAGLGPLGGDGDFCFTSTGVGYIVDGGFAPSLRSFNMTALTSAPITILPGFPRLRGLAPVTTDPNQLYGFDWRGNMYLITNVAAGFGNVVPLTSSNPLSTPLVPDFPLGGLAVTTGNNLFCVDNWSANPSNLRQVNPATGALAPPLSVALNNVSGITFGPMTPLPPATPPPGTGGGGTGFTTPGSEGSFYGVGRSRLAVLSGPFLFINANGNIGAIGQPDALSLPASGDQLATFNISHLRQAQRDGRATDSSSGPGSVLLTVAGAALVALLAALVKVLVGIAI
jgi:hypothetical protein